MARVDLGGGAIKAFHLGCSKTESSRYDAIYEAARFGPGPRLGRMIVSIIILPKGPVKRKSARKSAKRKRSR